MFICSRKLKSAINLPKNIYFESFLIKNININVNAFFNPNSKIEKELEERSAINIVIDFFRLCAHQLIKEKNYVHPHPFDPLCEYMILSIIWTLLINLMLLLLSFFQWTISIIMNKIKPRTARIIAEIKQNVEKNKGNTDGCLCFSIQWNDLGYHDKNDLDAHCTEPFGNEIYYKEMKNPKTGGYLDIDNKELIEGEPACENITWKDINKMEEGQYRFYVHNFEDRKGKSGFRATIKFGNHSYLYDYRKVLAHKENVDVAYITLKNKKFTIEHKLPYEEEKKRFSFFSFN